jgi:hypothetical protein
LPLVAEFIGSGDGKKTAEEEEKGQTKPAVACNDRLVQLLVKGLLYERAMDFCQEKAVHGKNGPIF